MDDSLITHCPGTLASGFKDYSPTALKHVFNGKKVSAILPYPSPASNEKADELFIKNRSHMSISGVQEKFSVVLEKNKLRLALKGEQGQYILKPIPNAGKKSNQMPANEHLTMQIARQVFNIETAQNALIFFNNGAPAYITKRFDIREEKQKWAQEDFAALAGRTPQTQGENYKYVGNYLDVFHVLKKSTHLSDEFDPKDVCIGHSYFIHKDDEAISQRIKYEIKPILEEYIKDGVLKDSPELREEIDSLK
jgi:serine/threonine-protein kinase HipA